MMKYIPVGKQVLNERKKREAAEAKVHKQEAQIAYIAMMSGVDIEVEKEEETNEEQI